MTSPLRAIIGSQIRRSKAIVGFIALGLVLLVYACMKESPLRQQVSAENQDDDTVPDNGDDLNAPTTPKDPEGADGDDCKNKCDQKGYCDKPGSVNSRYCWNHSEDICDDPEKNGATKYCENFDYVQAEYCARNTTTAAQRQAWCDDDNDDDNEKPSCSDICGKDTKSCNHHTYDCDT